MHELYNFEYERHKIFYNFRSGSYYCHHLSNCKLWLCIDGNSIFRNGFLLLVYQKQRNKYLN